MSNVTDSVALFQEQGYLIVTNLMQTHKIYPKFLEYAKKHKSAPDTQCPNSTSFYNTDIGTQLHDQLHKEVEKWTGLELHKTYCYWRKYNKGSMLPAHVDRPSCEISLTMPIGFEGNPWELYVLTKDGNPIRTFLNPGDALFYKGCERTHWRPRLKESDHQVQIFLHYVDKNGPYTSYKGDVKR